MSKEQKIALLYKNGITAKDLKTEYESGMNRGIETTFRSIYAATCLAVDELFGFKRNRCKKLLQKIDEIVIYSLTSAELVQEVFDRLGLELNFGDGLFDRISDKNERT